MLAAYVLGLPLTAVWLIIAVDQVSRFLLSAVLYYRINKNAGASASNSVEERRRKMSREFLYELLSTASVSGFEEDIQRKVMKYCGGICG